MQNITPRRNENSLFPVLLRPQFPERWWSLTAADNTDVLTTGDQDVINFLDAMEKQLGEKSVIYIRCVNLRHPGSWVARLIAHLSFL